jgi:peptidoglycan/LPS O-acetylase OafA/YrhL
MSVEHRSNNFDFIRLLAASSVLCAHQLNLYVRQGPALFGQLELGTLAVLVFFSISGYLVAQSWDRDPHILRFAAKRFLRVWPGLAVVTCLAVLIVGPATTTLSAHDYFHSPETRGYFSLLYLDSKFFLPGVFARNPFHVVNGSLWTIPLEAACYGVLLSAGFLGLLQRKFRGVLLIGCVLYAIYIYGIFDVQHNPTAAFLQPHYGCEYGTYFYAGVLIYRYSDEWYRYRFSLAGLFSVLALLLCALNRGYAAVYMLMPFLVIWFGCSSTPVLRRFGRYGDYSYGIYIYAYLVQQALIFQIGIGHPIWMGLLASAGCTLVCAVLSWHFIEKPALTLKFRLGRRDPSQTGNADIRTLQADLPVLSD